MSRHRERRCRDCRPSPLGWLGRRRRLAGQPDQADQLLEGRGLRLRWDAKTLAFHFPCGRRNGATRGLLGDGPRRCRRTRYAPRGGASMCSLTTLRRRLRRRAPLRLGPSRRGPGTSGRMGRSSRERRQTFAIERRRGRGRSDRVGDRRTGCDNRRGRHDRCHGDDRHDWHQPYDRSNRRDRNRVRRLTAIDQARKARRGCAHRRGR